MVSQTCCNAQSDLGVIVGLEEECVELRRALVEQGLVDLLEDAARDADLHVLRVRQASVCT